MSDELLEIELIHDSGGSTTYVVALTPTRLRVECAPLWDEPWGYHDVIEVEPVAPYRYAFVRIAERGNWRRFDYLVHPTLVASRAYAGFLTSLNARSCYHERVFGGCLFIFVPPGVVYDPTEDLRAAIESVQDETAGAEEDA